MNTGKKIIYALAILALGAAVYISKNQIPFESSIIGVNLAAQPASGTLYLVARVIDGDTFVLDTGEQVRYIGINTPETVDPRKSVECFGKEASQKNKELILNKKVKLVKDVSETDKYNRLLRYVYLEDGTFVNYKLVAEGYASVMTVPPDVAHSAEFVKAQKEAREKGLGLWGKCDENPKS